MSKPDSVISNTFKSFALMLIAAMVGGFLVPALMGWACPKSGFECQAAKTVISSGDAVSIANTYIVFTTLFIVVVAALLTLGTMELSRKLAQNEADRLNRLIDDDLIPKLIKHEEFGRKFIEALFKNENISDRLTIKVEDAVNLFIESKGMQSTADIEGIKEGIES